MTSSTERSRARLPPGVRAPFEVYLNGVRQEAGRDYELRDGTLLFGRALAQEGKLGAGRWLLGAFGIGTYRRNDTIDVRYELDGRPMVAHALPLEPDAGPRS